MTTIDRLRRTYDSYEWVRADQGASGAAVYRLTGERAYYLKVDPEPGQVAAEADRLEWLAGQGIPAPGVVERGEDWLITEAVAGVPASSDWPVEQLDRVVDALARVTAELHALPVEGCPFRRDLEVTTELAAGRVRAGLVDLENLEDEYAGWTGDQLLERLVGSQPAEEDLVVCHGDLTPENVLLDPSTGEVTGLIDVGRLGVADRWLDLAIAYREVAAHPSGPKSADRYLARYGTTLNKPKLAYYVLLDEFF